MRRHVPLRELRVQNLLDVVRRKNTSGPTNIEDLAFLQFLEVFPLRDDHSSSSLQADAPYDATVKRRETLRVREEPAENVVIGQVPSHDDGGAKGTTGIASQRLGVEELLCLIGNLAPEV